MTEKAWDYEVAVIGGGPGGYVAAIKAAQMGKKTCIIEKEHFGGVCLNQGCIPTKILLRSVEALKEAKESGLYGVVDIDVSKARLDMVKVQERKNTIIKQLVGGVNGLLKGNGVCIKNGEATFQDSHTLLVDGVPITAESIIIASGSEAKSLPVPISPETWLLTSSDALDLKEIPKHITVVGGGVIGIEFAYFMASSGSKVTVIEFMDRILPMVDEEIVEQVADMLVKMGVSIITGARLTEIKGKVAYYEKNGEKKTIESEAFMISVGRLPKIDGLNLDATGVKTDRGAVITDNRLKTNVNNIYAIGDVNGKAMLAHVASMEGIIAVENICGKNATMDYEKVPCTIYIQPEIASVGLTEVQAMEKYDVVKVGRFPLFANGKAKVAGEERGLVKVIIDPKFNEIIGVHIYCIHATDMISEAVVAMKLEGTAEEIAMSIHPHPTVSEAVQEAFHGAVDRAIHFL